MRPLYWHNFAMKKLLPLVWLAIFSCTHKKRAEPIPEAPTKYSRAEFDHWIDDDHDCQNTRQEMLVARSLEPVTFTAKAKKKKCTVKTGQWKDFYFHEVLENAQEVDVDHVVPLKHAWDVGAYAWNEAKRREFAMCSRTVNTTARRAPKPSSNGCRWTALTPAST